MADVRQKAGEDPSPGIIQKRQALSDDGVNIAHGIAAFNMLPFQAEIVPGYYI